MDIDRYQKEAVKTDQYPGSSRRSESISLFGLIGEIGSVISTFKKRLRDKDAYTRFNEDLKEELGDVLWYLANLSHKYHLNLSEIANQNLKKTKALWSPGLADTSYELYDASMPERERIPRQFEVAFSESGEISDAGFTKVQISIEGSKLGNPLSDNAYTDDGYRFHDVFHLAFAAVLGWSPVLRRMMGKKRKSKPEIDEVEDGARASFTEEMIAIFVYSYARDHCLFQGTDQIDEEVLRTIKTLVRGLEVESRAEYEWKHAILEGYKVFRALKEQNGGKVAIDLKSRKIELIS